MVLAHRFPAADFDQILISRARAGDAEAFAALMREYGGVVTRLIRQFVHDADDARDVEQETWIRAASSLHTLRDEGRLRPWLKSIARNSSLNFLATRKRQQGRVSTFDDCGTDDFEDTSGAGSPERHALSRDSQRKVWEVLGGLSERDRTALFLREYRELSYSEVALRLGISRNAAEVCVFRARERFRRLFAELDDRPQPCGLDPFRLSSLIDGEMDAESAEVLRGHVASCAACEERLTTMRAGQALYRNLGMFGFPVGSGTGFFGHLTAAFGRLASLFTGGASGAAGTGGAGLAAGGAASGVALVGASPGVAAVAAAIVVTIAAAGAAAAGVAQHAPRTEASPPPAAIAAVAVPIPDDTPDGAGTWKTVASEGGGATAPARLAAASLPPEEDTGPAAPSFVAAAPAAGSPLPASEPSPTGVAVSPAPPPAAVPAATPEAAAQADTDETAVPALAPEPESTGQSAEGAPTPSGTGGRGGGGLPPGLAKRVESGQGLPPGQAAKQGNGGESLPPGLAAKQDGGGLPPGQAAKQDDGGGTMMSAIAAKQGNDDGVAPGSGSGKAHEKAGKP